MIGPIARNTIATCFLLGLRVLLQGGILLLLARVLGPEDFGAYVGFGALAIFLGSLSSFGTNVILLREAARDSSQVFESLRLTLGTFFICAPALLLIYFFLCAVWLKVEDFDVLVIIFVGLAEIMVQPVFMISAMERHGRGEILASQIQLNLPLLMRLLIAIIISVSGTLNALLYFAIGHLASVTVFLVIFMAAAPGSWPMPWRCRTPSTREWKEASGYVFAGASSTALTELDKLLAVKLMSANVAGVYVAGSRVISALVLPIVAMMISAMPRLFRGASSIDRNLCGVIFLCAASYGIVAALSIRYAAHWLPIIFGYRYESIVEVIQFLAWAVAAMSLRFAAANLLITDGRPWLRIAVETSGWLMMAIGAFMLTPIFGMRGFIFALIISEWFIAVVSWVIIFRIQFFQKSVFRSRDV